MDARWRRSLVGYFVAVAACSYGDPEVVGSFKCDKDHPCPGNRVCTISPKGNVCVASGVDPDGGIDTFDGIECGGETCGEGQQCCASAVRGASCQPAGAACDEAGDERALCDGPEDCGDGRSCCFRDGSPSCGDVGCKPTACDLPEDCFDDGLTCCYDLPYVPWGRCGQC